MHVLLRSLCSLQKIESEGIMNKDRAEGKVKDIAGRVERQVGEWTGDTDAQVKGTLKQVEGKAQNAWGKAKDAVKKPADGAKPRPSESDEETAKAEEEESRPIRRTS
jgi:uncharacterized protein YjbJ (UPF0337 family)